MLVSKSAASFRGSGSTRQKATSLISTNRTACSTRRWVPPQYVRHIQSLTQSLDCSILRQIYLRNSRKLRTWNCSMNVIVSPAKSHTYYGSLYTMCLTIMPQYEYILDVQVIHLHIILFPLSLSSLPLYNRAPYEAVLSRPGPDTWGEQCASFRAGGI